VTVGCVVGIVGITDGQSIGFRLTVDKFCQRAARLAALGAEKTSLGELAIFTKSWVDTSDDKATVMIIICCDFKKRDSVMTAELSELGSLTKTITTRKLSPVEILEFAFNSSRADSNPISMLWYELSW
jgi:hypothetical protein